ncbi:threonine synthase [Dongia deserti]|uniref:threonine synthase n=1 Tax=Dongia deserti TaxID=2268030 RepID=UPI000E647764|nr:threonine synthase [Dongia deserti]
MRYISTRGAAPALGFTDVLLAGLARDGGLYVPETWPKLTPDGIRKLRGLSYEEIAFRIMQPFVGAEIENADLQAMIAGSYGVFRHQAVVPMKQLDDNLWLMELFHGPTLAFKDVALQLVGRLYDHALAKRGERVTIIGATSGDTGSAALEACRDRAGIDIFMLHPKGRVSEVQRRQMTTIDSANVFNIAIDGSFDDCQDLVKAMFNDHAFRDRINMSAVNSINWARVMAQVVYYAAAAVALGAPDRRIGFSVPSGNFGNIFAGYVARQMGFDLAPLIVGANRNDILARFFKTGRMEISGVEPSLSPSMDIQVSSNLERLLFDLYDRDGKRLAEAMTAFRQTGTFAAPKESWGRIEGLFRAAALDDPGTLRAMGELYRTTGDLIDPHSAIGIHAAAACRADRESPIVALATAHPAKFPDAVEKATGIRPRLPEFLADLYERPERMAGLPNDVRAVQDYVLSHRRNDRNG